MFSFYLFGKCPITTLKKNIEAYFGKTWVRRLMTVPMKLLIAENEILIKTNFSLPTSLIFLFRRTEFKTFQHQKKPLFFFHVAKYGSVLWPRRKRIQFFSFFWFCAFQVRGRTSVVYCMTRYVVTTRWFIYSGHTLAVDSTFVNNFQFRYEVKFR